jgi:membrane protein implicated in regulation of membrane protease activity
MTTWHRYLLLQIPGWTISAIILFALWYWLNVPLWLSCGLWAALVTKDFVIYPFVRGAYEANVRTGAERLIDAQGIARQTLDPHGYIKIRGELWRAEAESTDRPITSGSPVAVRGARGLTLIVSAEKDLDN